MIKIDLKRHKREVIGAVIVLLLLLGGVSVFKYTSFNTGFEIADDLGGNIFPSAILSVATTDAQVIIPSDSTYLGNPKSCIAIRLKSKTAYSRVRIGPRHASVFLSGHPGEFLNLPKNRQISERSSPRKIPTHYAKLKFCRFLFNISGLPS